MARSNSEPPRLTLPCRHDVDSLKIWRVKLRGVKHAVLPSSASRPNPLAVGRRLFLSIFSPGAVVCLDRDSGSIIWRRRLVPYGGSHVLYAKSLLYAKTPHTLYCLEPDTGQLVWKFSPAGAEGETMYSAPSVRDGRLFIGDRQGYLHALDAHTGRPLWRVLTSRALNHGVNGPPLIQRDRVLVATNAGRLLSIEAETGAIVWNESVGHPCTREILVCADAFVVLTSAALNWFDRQTGRLSARHQFPPQRWVSSFASRRSRLLVVLSGETSKGEVLGFQDAKLLFTKQLDSVTSLRWAPSGLLVETRYDGIGILNPLNGERIHNVEFHEHCEAAQPAEIKGSLYVLTAMGAVFALRWPPPGRPTKT